MSRRMTVYRCSWPSFRCEMEASAGNSRPSSRRAWMTACPPMVRLVLPLAPNWRTRAAWPARARTGMRSSMDRPSSVPSSAPNMRVAATFAPMMRCCSSMVMTASMAASTMPRSRARLVSRASRLSRICAAMALKLRASRAISCGPCSGTGWSRLPVRASSALACSSRCSGRVTAQRSTKPRPSISARATASWGSRWTAASCSAWARSRSRSKDSSTMPRRRSRRRERSRL